MHVLPLISTCSGTLPVHPTCFAGTLSPASFSGKLRPAKNICLPSPQISAALLHPFPPAGDFVGKCKERLRCRRSLLLSREDLRKYREYREHPLDSRAFFCDESVPSGKVDEDRVSHVRFQKSPNHVVVFQPVLSK